MTLTPAHVEAAILVLRGARLLAEEISLYNMDAMPEELRARLVAEWNQANDTWKRLAPKP